MKNKKMKLIGGVLIIGFCVWLIVKGKYSARQLFKNHLLINGGYVYNCDYNSRGNAGRVFVEFTFKVDGKEINGSTVYRTNELSVSDCQKFFIGKSFPVVYQLNNYSNNNILLTAKDFKKYNYSMPDSLMWIKMYINDNE